MNESSANAQAPPPGPTATVTDIKTPAPPPNAPGTFLHALQGQFSVTIPSGANAIDGWWQMWELQASGQSALVGPRGTFGAGVAPGKLYSLTTYNQSIPTPPAGGTSYYFTVKYRFTFQNPYSQSVYYLVISPVTVAMP